MLNVKGNPIIVVRVHRGGCLKDFEGPVDLVFYRMYAVCTWYESVGDFFARSLGMHTRRAHRIHYRNE